MTSAISSCRSASTSSSRAASRAARDAMATTEAPADRGECRVASVAVAGIRNLADAELELESSLTLVHGPNGAGKSSLLEAVCLALTARSPRTSRQREVVACAGYHEGAGVMARTGEEPQRFLW